MLKVCEFYSFLAVSLSINQNLSSMTEIHSEILRENNKKVESSSAKDRRMRTRSLCYIPIKIFGISHLLNAKYSPKKAGEGKCVQVDFRDVMIRH